VKPTEFVLSVLSPQMETDSSSLEYWLPERVQELGNAVCHNAIVRTLHNQFPPYLFVLFCHQVWTALIPHLPLGVLLQNLRRLGRLWLLKGNRPIVAKILDALNNQSAIAESNLHPALVFVTLRNYECLGK
jgi:hypothetical protein